MSSVPSMFNRAMWLRVCPPMVVKSPPAKTRPSACTAIEKTRKFAFGSNESAKPVVASSRAMRLRVCPPMLPNSPPAKILPSACTAIAETALFAFGLKAVSSVPSGFSRAMRLRATPRTLVKLPPRRILPSGWATTTLTGPLAFGSNPSSADCPRTAGAPPASSTATENSKSAAVLALDVALANEVNAAT